MADRNADMTTERELLQQFADDAARRGWKPYVIDVRRMGDEPSFQVHIVSDEPDRFADALRRTCDAVVYVWPAGPWEVAQ